MSTTSYPDAMTARRIRYPNGIWANALPLLGLLVMTDFVGWVPALAIFVGILGLMVLVATLRGERQGKAREESTSGGTAGSGRSGLHDVPDGEVSAGQTTDHQNHWPCDRRRA